MDRTVFLHTADLVKELGDSPLQSGVTVREFLQWEGVSLWDAIAPFLVLMRFPLYTSGRQTYHSLSFKQKWRLLIRYAIKRFYTFKIPINSKKQKEVKSSNTALFLNFQPIFFRETLESSVELLKKNYQIDTIVISENNLPNPKKLFISFDSIFNYGNFQLQLKLKKYLKNWRNSQKELLQELPSLFNRKTQLWPIFKNEMRYFLVCEIPKLLQHLILAQYVLKQLQPRVIISPDDTDPRTRLYTLLAKKLNIPTLIMQQGPFDECASEWRFLSGDKVATYGPDFSKILLQFGVDSSQIQITGCPRFDILTKSSEEIREKVKHSFHIKNSQKIVLFASQPDVPGAFPNSKIRQEMIKAISKVCAQFEQLHLMVKPHPGENEREIYKLMGRNSQISWVDKKTDICDFIRASDIVITFFSTSGMLALMNKKPLICVQFGQATGQNLYEKYSLAPLARSPEELKKLLTIYSDTSSELSCTNEKKLERLVYYSDGKSANRVADLISSISLKN